MRMLRLALAQINPTVGDLDGNFDKVVAAMDRARDLGVDVLALPEMVITGYPPEDLLLKPAFIDQAIERTRAVAQPFRYVGAHLAAAVPRVEPHGTLEKLHGARQAVLSRFHHTSAVRFCHDRMLCARR